MHALRVWILLLCHLCVLTVVSVAPAVVVRSARSKAKRFTNVTFPALPDLNASALMLFGGLLCYVSFFAWTILPAAGRAISWLTVAFTLSTFLARSLRAEWRRAVSKQVVVVGCCIAAFAAVSLAATFSYGDPAHTATIANGRYLDAMPPDNILPGLLANQIRDGVRNEPFFGDWLSSDRPPLQSGAVLFFAPFVPSDLAEDSYQALAMGLQLLVIPALWMLLRRLRCSVATSLLVVACVCSSGTLVLHTVYVWPKLLCAAFSLLSIERLLLPREAGSVGVSFERSRVAQSALATGFAFASHGGAVFIALPLAFVVSVVLACRLVQRQRAIGFGATVRGSRSVGLRVTLAAIILVGLYVPWALYARVVAPPGNRLLKWHLAGEQQVDDRGTWQAIRDGYEKAGRSVIVKNKRSNFRELVNSERFAADIFPLSGSTNEISRVRQREFGHLGNSIALTVLGFTVGGVHAAIRRRLNHELWFSFALAGFGILATVLWCLILFGPRATLPHQGSLAVPTLALAAGALAAASAGRFVLLTYAGISVFRVLRIWLLVPPIIGDGMPEPRFHLAAVTLLVPAVLAIGVAVRCTSKVARAPRATTV